MGALALFAAEETVAPLGTYKPLERKHWAFVPRKQITPPAIKDPWIKTPIDAFILEGLRKAGLKPAPPADRATLIRRVTFDLTGLPPTPEEIDAFVGPIAERLGKGRRPPARFAALRRTVGPPLARRGALRRIRRLRIRHCTGPTPGVIAITWFRASTTTSLTTNSSRSNWPATRWIRRTQSYLVASGFNRLGPLRKNAGNQDVASSRNEVLTEMTNIVGAAFLGVTVGCARCHDHKFDPFRQSDYYRMQAHFAQTQPNDIVLASKEEQDAWKAKAEPDPAGDAPAASRRLRRAPDERKGQDRNADSKSWTTRCRRRWPPSTRVTDDPKKASPIHLLFHGDYLQPRRQSGRAAARNPAAGGNAGAAARHAKSRARNWPTGSSIRPIR